jgi:hypothetical protein
MSNLYLLFVVWGSLTTVLIVLLIYRATLSNHEDDQLFLDEAEAHMQAEQVELMKRMKRLSPFVRLLGAASGLLILLIIGIAVWQQIMLTQ